jgi:hypothetical protein
MAEQDPVKIKVVGSSPTRGAKLVLLEPLVVRVFVSQDFSAAYFFWS